MRNLPDEATGTNLTADEYNSLKKDIVRVAVSAGVSIDGPLGPDSSDNHLSEAIASYAQNSSFYTDIGGVNSYSLVKGTTNFKEPPAYTEGRILWAKIGNTNTGASVISFGGLAVKPLVAADGSPLTPGALTAGQYASFVYRAATDKVELLFSPASTHTSGVTTTTLAPAAQTVVGTSATATGKSKEWVVDIVETSGSLQKSFKAFGRVHGALIDYYVYGVTGDTIPTQVTFTTGGGIVSILVQNNHSASIDIETRLTV